MGNRYTIMIRDDETKATYRWETRSHVIVVETDAGPTHEIPVPSDVHYVDWHSVYELFDGLDNTIAGRDWYDDGTDDD